MKKNFIKTQRLVLRPFCEEDLIYLKELLKDIDVMKFSINGPYDEKKTKGFIDSSIENQKEYGFGAMAVFLKNTDEWIGFCAIFREKEKIQDFGFRFFKEYWGKGYATEAVSECCSYLKKNFPDEKIYCYIDPENKSSIRVAEKSNMTCLGKGHLPWIKCFKYQI